MAAVIASVVLVVAGLPLTAYSQSAGDGLAWSNETGPAGGPMGAITGDEHVLVAGGWQGLGAYVSHDGGLSWEQVEDFPPLTEVHNAAWSPHGDGLGFVSGYGGLARTTDGGESWEHLLDRDYTGPIAFHAQQEGVVAINYRPDGTFNQDVWLSLDGGDSWTDLGEVPGSGISLSDLVLGPTPDHIFAAYNFRSAVTTDGGETWTEFTFGGRSIAQEDDGTLWLTGFGPLKKSTDHGLSWQEVDVPTGGSPSHVAARPGGGVFATTNDGILRTLDHGDSWTNLGFPEANWGVTDFIVDPREPDAVFLTDENIGVVWVGPTGTGHSLEGRTSGFPLVPVNALGTSQDGSVLLAGGQYGTYGSRDGGATWTHLGAGMGMASTRAVMANMNGEIIYSGGQTMIFSPWLASSQDGGSTWDFASINIGGDGYVSGLATHPEDPLVAWAAVWGEFAPSHVFETTNGGESWEVVLVTNDKVHDVAYHAPSGMVLAATSLGVQAREPITGLWVTVSPGSLEARSVATHDGQVFAGVEAPQVFRSPLEALPVLAPWGAIDGPARHVAPALEAGAWLTDASGSLLRCEDVGGAVSLIGECVDRSPPTGDLRASMVRPDGAYVFAASPQDGLWTASLT